jgi:prevent-host-death family protein
MNESNDIGDMLLKAQRAPVQINKNGKPVAVVLSVEEYESFETLKLRLLQSRAMQAMADIEAGSLVDGRGADLLSCAQLSVDGAQAEPEWFRGIDVVVRGAVTGLHD